MLMLGTHQQHRHQSEVEEDIDRSTAQLIQHMTRTKTHHPPSHHRHDDAIGREAGSEAGSEAGMETGYRNETDLPLDSTSSSTDLVASMQSSDADTDSILVDDATAPPTSSLASTLARCAVAGTGFMCDAYDLFVINLVVVVIKYAESRSNEDGSVEDVAAQESVVSTAGLAGSVVGQLMFGVLADILGRRKCFIITLSLLMFGAFGSCASFRAGTMSVWAMLAFFRFILGVGIGGEYPLAATVSSESSEQVKGRGVRVASVFSMQGVGMFFAPVLVLIFLAATPASKSDSLEVVWRLALGIGGAPALFMIIPRIRMKESKAYSMAGRTTLTERWQRMKEYRWGLFNACWSWFLFDIIFYANSLFSSQVVKKWIAEPLRVNFETTEQYDQAVHKYLIEIALSTMYLAILALPGYWTAIYLIDRIGRRKLQLLGFIGMTITYFLCAVLAPELEHNRGLLYFLYGTTFFFCNCGPNVSTYVIPSEQFPTNIRSTSHGLAAAAGKVGGVIGGAMMPFLLNKYSLAVAFGICAVLSAIGIVTTFILTAETMHTSLVDPSSSSSQSGPVVPIVMNPVVAWRASRSAQPRRLDDSARFASGDDESIEFHSTNASAIGRPSSSHALSRKEKHGRSNGYRSTGDSSVPSLPSPTSSSSYAAMDEQAQLIA